VLAPKAHGAQTLPIPVLGKPWIAPPPSAATQSFLAFWVEGEDEAHSLASYYRTKLFRFLVSLRKITQDALRPMYSWVPMQSWDRRWTDAELYAKYKLTPEEIAYIESVIRPMEANGEGNDA
jgi:site-specific DNA-methyltransferase (adenine-specific)